MKSFKEEDAKDSRKLFAIQKKSYENSLVCFGKRKLKMMTKAGNTPGAAQKGLVSVSLIIQ